MVFNSQLQERSWLNTKSKLSFLCRMEYSPIAFQSFLFINLCRKIFHFNISSTPTNIHPENPWKDSVCQVWGGAHARVHVCMPMCWCTHLWMWRSDINFVYLSRSSSTLHFLRQSFSLNLMALSLTVWPVGSD